MGRPGLHGQMLGLKEDRLWAQNDVKKMKTVIYWFGMAFLQAPRAAIGTGNRSGEIRFRETRT